MLFVHLLVSPSFPYDHGIDLLRGVVYGYPTFNFSVFMFSLVLLVYTLYSTKTVPPFVNKC
jgi:hypothetical protein